MLLQIEADLMYFFFKPKKKAYPLRITVLLFFIKRFTLFFRAVFLGGVPVFEREHTLSSLVFSYRGEGGGFF